MKGEPASASFRPSFEPPDAALELGSRRPVTPGLQHPIASEYANVNVDLGEHGCRSDHRHCQEGRGEHVALDTRVALLQQADAQPGDPGRDSRQFQGHIRSAGQRFA